MLVYFVNIFFFLFMLEFPFIFGFGMISNWKPVLACNCVIFLCLSGYPWSTAFYYVSPSNEGRHIVLI